MIGTLQCRQLSHWMASVIEVGDRKFRIIFHQREENIELSVSTLAYRRGH